MSDQRELLLSRKAIQSLLNQHDPAAAVTVYYALYHPPERTRLAVHRAPGGQPDGFLAQCVTGFDLFRPVVVLWGEDEKARRELLQLALDPGRPYFFIVPWEYQSILEEICLLEEKMVAAIYWLDPKRFEPTINVMVVETQSPDGSPRYEIRSEGQTVAASGTNWRSPYFGEVYVYTEPQARGRRWARAVLSACSARLIQDGQVPIYVVELENEASIRVALATGYQDTGTRLLLASGVLRR